MTRQVSGGAERVGAVRPGDSATRGSVSVTQAVRLGYRDSRAVFLLAPPLVPAFSLVCAAQIAGNVKDPRPQQRRRLIAWSRLPP
jgi:hypothetical protein